VLNSTGRAYASVFVQPVTVWRQLCKPRPAPVTCPLVTWLAPAIDRPISPTFSLCVCLQLGVLITLEMASVLYVYDLLWAVY